MNRQRIPSVPSAGTRPPPLPPRAASPAEPAAARIAAAGPPPLPAMPLADEPPPAVPDSRVILADEPGEPVMRIPSGWLAKPAPPAPRFGRSPALLAAGAGVGAGLLVLLPMLPWLTGGMAAGRPKPAKAHRAEATAARPLLAVSLVRSSSMSGSAAAADDALALAAPSVAEIVPTLLADAIRAIAGGDVLAARRLLANIDLGEVPAAHFALAETYDPNMLAAWGTRGIQADPVVALALYRRSLAGGIAAARARLEALD